MVATHRDLTTIFNNNNGFVQFDVSGYDYVIVHFISPNGVINFNGTLDGGANTGLTGENPTSAINFIAVQGTNLTTGVAATSNAATSNIYKFLVGPRYLQLAGAPGTRVGKLLITKTKIC